MALLEINNVSVRFGKDNAVQAVENVSIEVSELDRIAIVGETGSGKSILLLAVLGLLPPGAIVSGSVLYHRELETIDLLSLKRRELDQIRGNEISYIPQGSGESLNPLMKVGLQVGEPLIEHRKFTKRQAMEKSVELLSFFNLGNEKRRAREYPHTFSGGMRQRAMIAMGISAGAKLLLADEPTKGLDEKRVRMVEDSFRLLKEQTILCVTHDLYFAKAIGRTVSVMYAAQQVEYAPVSELFTAPLHPYTRDMLRALPENGLQCTEGFAPSHNAYDNTGCRYSRRCSDCFFKCTQPPPLADRGGHKVRCWKYAD